MDTALPAFYRTVDPIENLVVRVSIRKRPAADSAAAEIGVLPPLSFSATLVGGQGALPPQEPTLPSAAVFDDEHAERIVEFSWQQKVFGPGELLRLASLINDAAAGRRPSGGFSPLQREYMSILSSRLDAGDPVFDAVSDVMLFTYTDRDGYVPPSEVRRSLLAGAGDGGDAAAAAAEAGGAAAAATAAPLHLPPGPGAGASATAAASRAASPSPGRLSWRGSAAAAAGAPPPSASASLAAAVTDPHANPRGVGAHAFREQPFATMYIMAAVGIHKEGYRARRADTRMFEVPLLQIRHHPSRGGHADGGGATSLLEMRPGFAEPLPLEPAVMRAAVAAGLGPDSVLGPGRYGGELRLRSLRLPPTVAEFAGAGAAGATPAATVGLTSVGRPGAGLASASTAGGGAGGAGWSPARTDGGFGAGGFGAGGGMRGSSATLLLDATTQQQEDDDAATVGDGGGSSVRGGGGGSRAGLGLLLSQTTAAATAAALSASVGAIVEVHCFRTPDGAAYEYALANPSEDAVTAVLAARAAAATGDAVLALAASLASPLSHAGLPAALAAAAALAPTPFDAAAAQAAVAASDPMAALLAGEAAAADAAAHRVGSDFHSALPRGVGGSGGLAGGPAGGMRLHPRAFRVSCFLDIVAAAKFTDAASSGAGGGVFVAYELVLPPGGGWVLLADGGGRRAVPVQAPAGGRTAGGDGPSSGATTLLGDVVRGGFGAAIGGGRKAGEATAAAAAGAGGGGGDGSGVGVSGSGESREEYAAAMHLHRLRASQARVTAARRRRSAADGAAPDVADEGAVAAELLAHDLGRSDATSGRLAMPPNTLASADASAYDAEGASVGARVRACGDAEGASVAGAGGLRRRHRRHGGSSNGASVGGDAAPAAAATAGVTASPPGTRLAGSSGGWQRVGSESSEDEGDGGDEDEVGSAGLERGLRADAGVGTVVAGVTQVARFALKHWHFGRAGAASAAPGAGSASARPSALYDPRYDAAAGGAGSVYPSLRHSAGAAALRRRGVDAQSSAAAAAAPAQQQAAGAAGAAAATSRLRQRSLGVAAAGAAEAAAAVEAAAAGFASGAAAIVGPGTTGPLALTTLGRGGTGGAYTAGAGSVSLVSTASFDGVTLAGSEGADSLARAAGAGGPGLRYRLAPDGASGSLVEALGLYDAGGGGGGLDSATGPLAACCCCSRGSGGLLSSLDPTRVPVANICCPLEIHLLCDPAAGGAEEVVAAAGGGGLGGYGGSGGTAHLAAVPTLHLAVYSRDGWGRHTVQGYGSLPLPLCAGSRDHLVRTWVPVAPAADAEAQFFLGGWGGLGADHDAAAFVAVPADVAARARLGRPDAAAAAASGRAVPGAAAAERAAVSLSKLGLRTAVGGELGMRSHTVLVRNRAEIRALAARRQEASDAASNARARSVAEIIAQARSLRERLKGQLAAAGPAGVAAGSEEGAAN